MRLPAPRARPGKGAQGFARAHGLRRRADADAQMAVLRGEVWHDHPTGAWMRVPRVRRVGRAHEETARARGEDGAALDGGKGHLQVASGRAYPRSLTLAERGPGRGRTALWPGPRPGPKRRAEPRPWVTARRTWPKRRPAAPYALEGVHNRAARTTPGEGREPVAGRDGLVLGDGPRAGKGLGDADSRLRWIEVPDSISRLAGEDQPRAGRACGKRHPGARGTGTGRARPSAYRRSYRWWVGAPVRTSSPGSQFAGTRSSSRSRVPLPASVMVGSRPMSVAIWRSTAVWAGSGWRPRRRVASVRARSAVSSSVSGKGRSLMCRRTKPSSFPYPGGDAGRRATVLGITSPCPGGARRRRSRRE